MALSPLQKKKHRQEEEEEEIGKTDTGTPIRYLPLDHVYSASQCVNASGSSNVMSKKVKARKLTDSYHDLDDSYHDLDDSPQMKKQQPFVLKSFANVYVRRRKKPSCSSYFVVPIESDLKTESNSTNFVDLTNSDNLETEVICDGEKNRGEESENAVESVDVSTVSVNRKRKRNTPSMAYELAKLGIDSSFLSCIDTSGTRERRQLRSSNATSSTKKQISYNICRNLSLSNGSGSDKVKKWIELSYKDVDLNIFVGFQCKVYWPLDDEWYTGRVDNYNTETGRHHVSYDDGEKESLVLSKEKIKFHISYDEMQQLGLQQNLANKDDDGLNSDELLVLAAIFEESDDVEVGDIVWGKIAGHAVWPAVVVDESNVALRKALNANHGESAVPVQFFGTHDFAWITTKQVISFLRGLHSSYHLKCKQPRFRKSLEEAKLYLIERQLPNKMLCVQNGIEVDDCESASEEDDEYNTSDDSPIGDKRSKMTSNHIQTCPFEIGNLRVISLGKAVTDSEHFHDDQHIWPEGYTAERKFTSVTDTSLKASYKMEVLRDPESKFRPLFRVTIDSGEEFKGSTPATCWNKIYRRIRKLEATTSNGFTAGIGSEMMNGSYMFGFSNAKVSKLIKELSNSRKSSTYSGCKLAPKKNQDLPVGYRPVRVEWKDLDKCNVCHMDEEYVNNVFLQCDKCRMLVHARCYGESESVDGVLWLCKLCRPDAPEVPPPCRLCPVIGGAMKPTTDGGWAHLACAIWIPETCLLDIKNMEPIDGLKRINKDRWKLLCSICGVAYGACIQCSNSTCCVAYHPLCARAAGLCVELEDEDKLHLMSFDEDEEDQCIQFFSFCKKHRQPSNDRSQFDERKVPVVRSCSKYIPPANPSGCARTEPYDFFGRRGRKEPEAVAAASLKRLYVENRPYLVTGYRQNGSKTSTSSNEMALSRFSSSTQKSNLSQLDASKSVLSMAEKFNYMRGSVRIRLATGKSGIHGYGVFAKLPHKAGDMMIEYTGELVRPSIADRREHFIYNSLVGAGTYMFRIDDERVIDATRAGSIAHLINHSCEPNCYSRMVSIHGEDHIIIFAKRDISAQEELTYDYRFFSIGERLPCYCGFPRCRGVVNDIEAEEQAAKLRVPRSELVEWKGD